LPTLTHDQISAMARNGSGNNEIEAFLYQTVAGRQTCYCGAIFRGELWPSSGTGSRICLVAGRVLPFVPVKPPLDRVHDAPIN